MDQGLIFKFQACLACSCLYRSFRSQVIDGHSLSICDCLTLVRTLRWLARHALLRLQSDPTVIYSQICVHTDATVLWSQLHVGTVSKGHGHP